MQKILLYLLDCVSATSEATPRDSSRSSSYVISWKFSNAPALLGFD